MLLLYSALRHTWKEGQMQVFVPKNRQQCLKPMPLKKIRVNSMPFSLTLRFKCLRFNAEAGYQTFPKT